MRVFILKGIRLIIYFALTLLFSCISRDSFCFRKIEEPKRDLAQILTEGKLVAITDFSSTDYFIYKGEPMGYQYEMLASLAENLGVKLELIAENSSEESIKMLKNGEVDIVANNLFTTLSNIEKVKHTESYRQTRQVLIQRKCFNSNGDVANTLIRNQSDLANKKVFVKKGSDAAIRLKNISSEISVPIIINEKKDIDDEQLIDLVATGEIEYAICDENIAKVQSTIYSNIDIDTPVSAYENLAWVVNSKSPDLLRKVNEWLAFFPKTIEYRNIYNKYIDNPYMAIMKKSEYFYAEKGKISIYDEQIKTESTLINWDWRLLASLIYQESKFNHNVKSESGAFGLMQFMPVTAEHMGIDPDASPSTQLRMGVRYLKMLEQYMADIKIPEKERVKFVLAAYNAGFGHIIDARNLARKYGKDPNVWDNNVGFFIQNKVDFYNDTVVKYGYLRGSETYRYVSEILNRYDHYKNIVKK